LNGWFGGKAGNDEKAISTEDITMKCPHCRNDMPEGATVCGHCGAYEAKVAPSWGMPVIFIGVFATFAIGTAVAIHRESFLIGLVGFALAAFVVPAVLSKILPKRTTWLHNR